MTVKLLPTQHSFVKDMTNREQMFCGGYGCGKTFAAAAKSLLLASKNPGHAGCILSPTHGMLVDTFIPTFEDMLKAKKIKYDYRASPTPKFFLHFKRGVSVVYCRSAENYRRLASLNLSWAVVDEGDLIPKPILLKMWKMAQARLRAKSPFRQLCMTTTPEGFEGAYELFVKEKKSFRVSYHASTRENHHLPEDYIDNLYSSYSDKEIQGYIDGEFTNLHSGTVYHCFNRTDSHTDKVVDDWTKYKDDKPVTAAALHIGVDFNIGKTCGMVCVLSKGIVYIVDEFTFLRDTEQLIDAINARYPNHQIYIYPDSSGKSQQTATTMTDIALLKNAFGDRNVRYPNKNPKIMNRVKAVNAMFLNGHDNRRMFVNTETCHELTSCLEQQAFDEKTGLPDKKNNLDHPLDALGYFVHHNNPIISRPTARNI